MDVSGVATSINLRSEQSHTARHADSQPPDRGKSPSETRNEREHGIQHRQGRALGAFSTELRIRLRAQFHAQIASGPKEYMQHHRAETPAAVADEALGTARQIVAEQPIEAARSLITFRAQVRETASFVRDTVGPQEGVADIDSAVAQVDEGLDALEEQVANNRESSASVLAVESRSKQRSVIRIRTQEGDVVKFDLRRIDQTSASDTAISNGDEFASATEVDVSSRSRLNLRIKGDINDSEMAAIQTVFAQAENIANEFFGGDIGAAFNAAQGFEFDSEQLARVNLRFRMRQDTSVSYAERIATATRPVETRPVEMRPVEMRPVETRPVAAPPAPPQAQPSGELAKPLPAPDGVKPVLSDKPILTEKPIETPAVLTRPDVSNIADTEQAIAEVPAADIQAVDSNQPVATSLAGFFELLSGFLRSIGDGFDIESGQGGFRFHYSESFKLEILKTVITTSAPDDAGDAATNAELVIDAVSETAEVDDD